MPWDDSQQGYECMLLGNWSYADKFEWILYDMSYVIFFTRKVLYIILSVYRFMQKWLLIASVKVYVHIFFLFRFLKQNNLTGILSMIAKYWCSCWEQIYDLATCFLNVWGYLIQKQHVELSSQLLCSESDRTEFCCAVF